MSFDYEKLKRKQAEGENSFWATYSDLFMMLSAVFLLLYVVTSLRTGTNTVQAQMEMQKLKGQAADYQKQIQAYNTLKDDYLKKEASEAEAKMYEELMSKLTLLQEDAKEEKKQLEAKAQENEAKAEALNQYQQMVRNIINTNLLSNKKIKFRNELIDKKNEAIKEMDETIESQTVAIQTQANQIKENEAQIENQNQEIKRQESELNQKKEMVESLQDQIERKSAIISENQKKIEDLNSDLNQNIEKLKKTSEAAQMSQSELNKKITMMKLENAKKISELKSENQGMQESLGQINQELSQAEGQLKDAKSKIAEQEAIKAKLEGEIAKANAEYEAQVAQMKGDFDQKMEAERKALEDQLNKEKASAGEKLKKLAEFKDKIAAEKAKLDEQLAGLKDEVGKAKEELGKAQGEASDLKDKLAQAKNDHGRYLAAIDQLQKDKEGLSGDLKRAQEINDAKKKLAKKIADNLKKNGIKAGVDGKSGDVTINFDEYFDTGKSDLKPNMRAILEKFVPVYSKSLLEDEKVASEISSVEIVGFSSPTYKGKYVDPQSLDENDRTAVSYNLDLSYNRAKSIFTYMFDPNAMKYKYQKEMLPLVKVTGRSYLAEEVKGRDIASGLSHKEYCKKFECSKSQKVIIKFNLKD